MFSWKGVIMQLKYEMNLEQFLQIPGCSIAYWITKNNIDVFKKSKTLKTLSNPCQGLITGDVNRFVRKWYECELVKTGFNSTKHDVDREEKWFPYSNGGPYRKWYGDNEDVVNWQYNGKEVIGFVDENGKQRSRPQNQQFYFVEGGTWTAISSGSFSVRYFPNGYLFSNAGMAIYADHSKLIYLIGFLNSKLSQLYLSFFNEGLNYNQGDIAKLPILISNENEVCNVVEKLIEISKEDWDSFETSWDFKKHPLI